MKELKDSAFIEISLFREPKKNSDSVLFDSKKNRKNQSGFEHPRKIQKDKKRKLIDSAEKKKMQDRWEKMYKSIAKSKKPRSGENESSLHDMEKKLKIIKNLRDRGKISDTEFQKRKQELLDEL